MIDINKISNDNSECLVFDLLLGRVVAVSWLYVGIIVGWLVWDLIDDEADVIADTLPVFFVSERAEAEVVYEVCCRVIDVPSIVENVVCQLIDINDR